jgi:hypothetical protein
LVSWHNLVLLDLVLDMLVEGREFCEEPFFAKFVVSCSEFVISDGDDDDDEGESFDSREGFSVWARGDTIQGRIESKRLD